MQYLKEITITVDSDFVKYVFETIFCIKGTRK